MPIYQTNTWICEVCGKATSETEEVTPYQDPVIYPPIGWGRMAELFTSSGALACSDCIEKENTP
jgi:hypothetical protein